MIWVILSLLFVDSDSAALGISYLPPPNAKDAGGHEDDLEVPLEPPYIDPYSDNRHLFPEEKLYNFGYGLRHGPTRGFEDTDQTLDSSDGFLKYPGRFLYGSYSYVGSDNVIVTVTYTSDRKKPKNKNTNFDDCDECGSRYDGDFELVGSGLVPLPPGLPRELQRAFAFHRKAFPNDNRTGNPWGKQFKNEEPAGESTTQRGHSIGYAEPVNYAVNNVQVSSALGAKAENVQERIS